MNVSAVNSVNSLSFKRVYYAQNNFSNRQGMVAREIVRNLLLRDFAQTEKTSYLDKYEKEGIDFLMEAAPDEESVNLYACKNLQKTYGGTVEGADKNFIGTFNNYKHFKLKYIENTDKKQEMPPQFKLFSMLVLAAGVVFLPLITHVRKSINPYYNNPNYSVKMDNIAADSIAKDTIKLLPKLKK